MSIPASDIVSVQPGVVGAGGSAFDLNGLILTADTSVPIGTVMSFANGDDVDAFFGATAPEAIYAGNYFLSYVNATKTPGAVLFAQYPTASVAGYLRGGSVAGLTMTQLQALSGTLIVTVDGVVKTSTAINLSAATSFSNAATIIAAGFTSLGGTVSYDSQRAAFKITSSTTGANSSVGFATGTLAAGINMTAATGAVTSQGAVAGVPATNMQGIVQISQNWAAFMTVFDPDNGSGNTQKLAFAAWTNSKNNRYAYVAWDTDPQAIVQNSTTCFGALVKASDFSGIMAVYKDPQVAAFVLGIAASLDFARTNGRTTFMFRSQTGLAVTVTDETTGDTLTANGYNFYGAWASRNNGWTFLANGQISGPFLWADAYFNQMWLNDSLQVAGMDLLTQVDSVPYNPAGDALVEQAYMDPINAALNFGAIRTGVTLSSLQAAEINNAAGITIAPTLQTRGWYFQRGPATAAIRVARGPTADTLWYTDGGAVQALSLASLDVQ
jgi:hypothetical protein